MTKAPPTVMKHSMTMIWVAALLVVATRAESVKMEERRLFSSPSDPDNRRTNIFLGKNHDHAVRERHIYGSSIQGWKTGERLRHLEETVTAWEACNAAIPLEETAGEDYGTSCTCTGNEVQHTATLVCTDRNCAYCSDDETICSKYSYGVRFDRGGQDYEYFEVDAYNYGRTESIVYTERDGRCSVSIDGTECTSCTMEDCGDGYYGVNVVCYNVESGATYQSCQGDFETEGLFEVYNHDEFGYCYTSFDVCERDALSVDPKYDCFCEVPTNEPTSTVLQCMDKCEYCSEDLSVCGQELYQQSFSGAEFTGSRRTVTYTEGRHEELAYEEFNCDQAGCRSCKFTVDGEPCDRCVIQNCADGRRAPYLSCSNHDEASSGLDFCQDNTFQGTLFEYFGDGFASECSSRAQIACKDAKKEYEQHEHKYACTCSSDSVANNVGAVELKCSATCGDLCNDDSSVCARETFIELFQADGESSYFRKDMQYTLGRKEQLSYFEYEDGLCSLKVDDVACSSCILQTCAGEGESKRSPLLDCTNIDGGEIMDLCDENLHVETGIFERFSMAEFQECMDVTPSNGACQTAEHLTNLPMSVSASTMMVAYDGMESCGKFSFAPGVWYTVVGSGTGLHASMCDSESDFDAHISVYHGTCNDLTCVIASEDDCSTTWFGEEGVYYHIRVHGAGAETGNFGMELKETNYAPFACVANKVAFEGDANMGLTCGICDEANEDTGEVELSCSAECDVCNTPGDTCVEKTQVTRVGTAGTIVLVEESFHFLGGRSEAVVVSKSECSGVDNCESCNVTIDGVPCDSCEMIACDPSGQQGMVVTCGSNLQVNTCDPPTLQDHALQVLTDASYQTCYQRSSMDVCLDHIGTEQQNDPTVQCECHEENGSYLMVCQRQDCLLCNKERTVCGYGAFGSNFGRNLGRVVGHFEGFQYIEGRTDLVSFHEEEETSEDCSVTLNHQQCGSCQNVTCAADEGNGPFHGVEFDCTNVPNGIAYDGCSMDISVEGVLDFVVEKEFQRCVPVDDPYDICQAALDETMEDGQRLRDSCVCEETAAGDYDLICLDGDDCQYCDTNGDICANYAEHRAEINRFGSIISHRDTYEFTKGRDELVVVRNSIGGECEVTVDGGICSSCDLVTCPDDPGSVDYRINCTNVFPAGGTFECGEGHDVFSVLSRKSSHHICAGATAHPTVSPQGAPDGQSNLGDLPGLDDLDDDGATHIILWGAVVVSSTLLLLSL